jgi:DNA modification methylase
VTDPFVLHHADCLDVLREMESDSIDSLVTDPPAGIEFMGKAWDSFASWEAGNSEGWEDRPEGRKFVQPGANTVGNPTCATCGKRRYGGKSKCRCEAPAFDMNHVQDLRTHHAISTRQNFIEAMTRILRECLRVLKPGAHGLVWAIPRTSHWTATALEDAGFEIRDVITHHFGSGFPKSLDVSKAIDKAAGAVREVVAKKRTASGGMEALNRINAESHDYRPDGYQKGENILDVTAPASPEAEQWSGWGTALKPATEHWILVRKPLGERNVAANVLEHGTGGINIDASRVAVDADDSIYAKNPHTDGTIGAKGIYNSGKPRGPQSDPRKRKGVVGTDMGITNADVEKFQQAQRESTERMESLGRWPSNVLLSHAPECELVGTKRVKGVTGSGDAGRNAGKVSNAYGTYAGDPDAPEVVGYVDEDGMETVEDWSCVEGCPVRLMDEQSGMRRDGVAGPRSSGIGSANAYSPSATNESGIGQAQGYGGEGGASRFFAAFHPFIYAPKASRADRNKGLAHKGMAVDLGLSEAFLNKHPTVKNTALMAWLVKLITPPGGTVLDCFMGSGSTGVAAVDAGFSFVGIEREAESYEVARQRLNDAASRPRLF